MVVVVSVDVDVDVLLSFASAVGIGIVSVDKSWTTLREVEHHGATNRTIVLLDFRNVA